MAERGNEHGAKGRKLRIAVCHPAVDPPTFIQHHIDRLQDVVLVLYDGMTPRRTLQGHTFMRTTLNGRMIDLVQAKLRGNTLQGEHSRRIAKMLKAYRIDVVLAEFGYVAMEMLDACRMAGVPMVAHFFGIDAHGRKYLDRYRNYSRIFQKGCPVVVVSREMERQLTGLGADPLSVHYICCGVDVQMFNSGDPASAPPHFVAVGRFVEKKAPHITLLAFAEVLKTRPDARLTMIGDGRLWEVGHQIVQALGIGDRVDLAGPASPKEVLERMLQSRAFVQHSVNAMDGDSEGTPVAIQEAMATGFPVISTRHAGIMDIMEHRVHGLLCDPLDLRQMAAHMIELANDPALAGELGRKAMEHARVAFPLERQIGLLQDVLFNAVKQRA